MTVQRASDSWTLTADAVDHASLYLANGYGGTTLPPYAGLVGGEPVPFYLRGTYSNFGWGGVDCLATLPCPYALRYAAAATVQRYQRTLDLARGVAHTHLVLQEERGTIEIRHSLLLSRADRHTAVARLEITPDFDGTVRFEAALESNPEGDVSLLDAGIEPRCIWFTGNTARYEIGVAVAMHFPDDTWTFTPQRTECGVTATLEITARQGEAVTLALTPRFVSAHDSPTPLDDVLQSPPPVDDLVAAHEAAWTALWRTNVEIDGDPEAEAFTRAALFYLWSTMDEHDNWSIAPMGLSSNFYNGHIFWDAELWMYPSLLVTQPDMARSCVSYRERTVAEARARAQSGGFTGAQFPWEGALTGEEMTPTFAETRDYQLHITSDVAIGQWWYYINTGDLRWLEHHGYPVIEQCAEFWVSRVEHNAELDRYEVSDVVCADEYAEHVNNNAFTNAAIRRSMSIAVRAAELLGKTPDPAWARIAERIYIPYDEEHGRHVEYDGFDGQVTKQADVELLAYPLEHTTDLDQIARDLDFYGSIIDPDGPAMSFSVYSVVSAQLGRAQAAYDYFHRAYRPNTHLPFYNFSETPSNNAYFFCTGAGGALQSILFGFTGIRLREGHFRLSPLLPPRWTALRLQGLYLLGARTDLEIDRRSTRLTRRYDAGSVTLVHEVGSLTVATEGFDGASLQLYVEHDGQFGAVDWTPGEAFAAPASGSRLQVRDRDHVLLDVELGM